MNHQTGSRETTCRRQSTSCPASRRNSGSLASFVVAPPAVGCANHGIVSKTLRSEIGCANTHHDAMWRCQLRGGRALEDELGPQWKSARGL